MNSYSSMGYLMLSELELYEDSDKQISVAKLIGLT